MREFATRVFSMANWISRKPMDRGLLSTGELIAVAVVLNKPQWLKESGYTLASALRRLDTDELQATLIAARAWEQQ